MAKTLIAVRNVSNRPLSFEFNDKSVVVRPGKVSDYISEDCWKGTFAEKQLAKYVKDKEAKRIYDTEVTENLATNKVTKTNKSTVTDSNKVTDSNTVTDSKKAETKSTK